MSAGVASIEGVEALKQRMSSVEGRQDEILDALKDIRLEMRGNSKTQWPVLIAGLTFMTIILGFVGTSWKAPIETTVNRLDMDIRQIQSTLTNQLVPRAEHVDKARQTDEMLSAMRERVTRDLNTERSATLEAEKRITERVERLEGRVFFSNPGKRTELTRNP